MQKGKSFFIIIGLILYYLLLESSYARNAKTGLPLPRFVSLRADIVNFRTGPGLRYPIEWVYQKKFMPLEILAEFDTWRKVRDWENTQGWVHQSTLSGKRTLVITNSTQTVRKYGNVQSTVIAEAEPGVIGKLLSCEISNDWCKVELGKYQGWLRRTQFWGVYAREFIE